MRLAMLLSIGAVGPTASAQLVIAGWDANRGGLSSLSDSAAYSSTRAAIAASFPGTTIRGVPSLTAASLDGAHVVWIGSGAANTVATTPLSAGEQSALLDFVSQGGVALIFGENSTFAPNAVAVNTSYFAPFEVPITGTLSGNQSYTLAAPQAFPMAGPWGQVASLSSGYPGWFPSLPSQGMVLARLVANSQIVVATLPAGALGPSSGAVWLFADTGAQSAGGTQGGNWNTLYLNILDAAVHPAPCYVNCDGSTTSPILNVNDFTCFLNKYAAGDSYANCDASTLAPVLNVNDFTCFLNRYAVGCP